MLRKLLDRLNPARQLPQAMRRYLALPNYLLLGWLVASGLVLFAAAGVDATAPEAPLEAGGATPAESPALPPDEDADNAEQEQPAAADSGEPAPAPARPDLDAALAEGAEIGVSGSASFTIRRAAGQLRVEGGGLPPMAVVGDGDELRLLGPDGAALYRLKAKSADKGKLYDAAGAYRWRVKCESEDGEEACKLYDPDGNKLHRVKIKADSFNVYGAGDQRLFKGKLKNGRYQVRDEAGNTVLDVQGAASLKEAALLAIPLEVPARILLWAYAGR